MDEFNWFSVGMIIGAIISIFVFAIVDESRQLDINEKETCLGFDDRDLGDIPVRCIKYFDLQNIEIVK